MLFQSRHCDGPCELIDTFSGRRLLFVKRGWSRLLAGDGPFHDFMESSRHSSQYHQHLIHCTSPFSVVSAISEQCVTGVCAPRYRQSSPRCQLYQRAQPTHMNRAGSPTCVEARNDGEPPKPPNANGELASTIAICRMCIPYSFWQYHRGWLSNSWRSLDLSFAKTIKPPATFIYVDNLTPIFLPPLNRPPS